MKSCISPNDMKDASFGYKKETVCINLLLTFEVTADASSADLCLLVFMWSFIPLRPNSGW